MLFPDSQIDAEPVPRATVPVMKMAFEPGTQILGQPQVVEFPLPLKRINTIPTPNIPFDDILMLL
ncbi:hypothetical protein EBX31_12205 [bacterium]|nr:hypothetical protein [bacterium]